MRTYYVRLSMQFESVKVLIHMHMQFEVADAIGLHKVLSQITES